MGKGEGGDPYHGTPPRASELIFVQPLERLKTCRAWQIWQAWLKMKSPTIERQKAAHPIQKKKKKNRIRVGILTKALRQCPARHFESLQPETRERQRQRQLSSAPALSKSHSKNYTYLQVCECVCVFFGFQFFSAIGENLCWFPSPRRFPLYDLPATRSAICQIV